MTNDMEQMQLQMQKKKRVLRLRCAPLRMTNIFLLR